MVPSKPTTADNRVISLDVHPYIIDNLIAWLKTQDVEIKRSPGQADEPVVPRYYTSRKNWLEYEKKETEVFDERKL